jgi:hypothetical protein
MYKLVPTSQVRARGFLDKVRGAVGFDEEQQRRAEVSAEDQEISDTLGKIFTAQAEQDSQERAEDQAEGLIQTTIEQQLL